MQKRIEDIVREIEIYPKTFHFYHTYIVKEPIMRQPVWAVFVAPSNAQFHDQMMFARRNTCLFYIYRYVNTYYINEK